MNVKRLILQNIETQIYKVSTIKKLPIEHLTVLEVVTQLFFIMYLNGRTKLNRIDISIFLLEIITFLLYLNKLKTLIFNLTCRSLNLYLEFRKFLFCCVKFICIFFELTALKVYKLNYRSTNNVFLNDRMS